jgi:two-component system cell cycle response regulator DivK
MANRPESEVRTILIVEDHPAHMKLAVLLLERAGFDVLQAADAETGLAMARERRPDAILMDVRLPGKDGLTASRELKQDERTKGIPVVMISSFSTEVLATELSASGAVGLITKPFHYNEFLRSIGRVLGRPETKPALPG